MSNEYDCLSFDTVLPSAIFINENIEPSAIRLFAFIKGLTKLHGYCYATNDYLVTLTKTSLRSVQVWLGSLKKEGYIEIETSKNGIHWQRRIYISEKFKKKLRSAAHCTPPCSTLHPPMQHTAPITKDYSNEDKLKREEASPAPTFFQVHKRVRIEASKYDKLHQELGAEKTLEMMDRLDEYADINPKRFKTYGCHAAVIRKWVREDKEKKGDEPKTLAIHNKEWAQKIISILKHRDIDLLPEALMIINHGNGGDFVIKYSENGFKDQVLNRLRKMNIDVKGL